MDQRMSKKEFWENGVSAKVKTGIKSAATAAFFSTVVTFIAAFFLDKSMIIDAILTLLLGLGIQLKKSRFCACFLTVYFVISKVMLLVYGFSPANLVTAVAFFVFFVSGIKYTFQYQKLWKSYLKGEYRPEEIDMEKIHEFLSAENHSQGAE